MQFLTDQERTQLKIQHKQERDGRIRDRIFNVFYVIESTKSIDVRC